jgi:uncharacterized protein with NRDE domain
VTNARETSAPAQPRSRGRLTLDFLLGADTPEDYAAKIAAEGAHYAGFNLLVGDRTGMYYCSNGEPAARGPKRLAPGIYGIANASLDTPWPKVESGKSDLRVLLRGEPTPAALFEIVATPAETAVPLPGLSMEAMTEHLQATRFINSSTYGTRASTALLLDRAGTATLWEQNFGSGGTPAQLSQLQWQLDTPT